MRNLLGFQAGWECPWNAGPFPPTHSSSFLPLPHSFLSSSSFPFLRLLLISRFLVQATDSTFHSCFFCSLLFSLLLYCLLFLLSLFLYLFHSLLQINSIVLLLSLLSSSFVFHSLFFCSDLPYFIFTLNVSNKYCSIYICPFQSFVYVQQ